MTSISVIIPAYNALTEVLTALTSLQNTASRQVAIEFIVADDCSPNVYFPALLPPCAAKVVRREVNGGFAENCNTGAAFAQGDILFFCNQDVSAHAYSANWDLTLVQAFENAQVGIVGAKLLFPNGSIQSAGGLYDAHLQPWHPCLGYANADHEECNTPQMMSWVTGAALAIRRDVFAQVGGFSLDYLPSYFEDVDLCEKVKATGLCVWYEPTVCLMHTVGSTGGSPHFMRSAVTFKRKWVDTGKLKPDTYAVKAGWW